MLSAAILVVGAPPSAPRLQQSNCASASDFPEMVAGDFISCLEIMGHSVVRSTILHLKNQGIGAITVVAEDSRTDWVLSLPTRDLQISLVHPPVSPWLAADRKVREYAAAGVEMILLLRLGAYVDLDFIDLLQFHRDKGQPVTRAWDSHGPLDVWIMDAPWADMGQISLGRPEDRQDVFTPGAYPVTTYVNRLRDAWDVRSLAVDALLSRCAIKPAGREVKPGVWVDEGASVHRTARLVAPAYIGKQTKVRAATLITRSSNLERGCEVDYGTVVEDASVLPNSYLGCCLDVSHEVIAGNKLVHLRHNVALEIADEKLISTTVPSAGRSFAAVASGIRRQERRRAESSAYPSERRRAG